MVEVEVKGTAEEGARPSRSQKCLLSISLKPSLTLTPEAPANHLECLFQDLELTDQLSHSSPAISSSIAQDPLSSAAAPSSVVDWSLLAIGSKIEGLVHEAVDYGLLVDLPSHPDLVGLVLPHQQAPVGPLSPLPTKGKAARDMKLKVGKKAFQAADDSDEDMDQVNGLGSLLSGKPPTPGAPVTARVLDLIKREGQVSLSTLPGHLMSSNPPIPTSLPPSSKTKPKGKFIASKAAVNALLPPKGSPVEAIVELVREAPLSYLVLRSGIP